VTISVEPFKEIVCPVEISDAIMETELIDYNLGYKASK
jgi:hypothetical protein